MLEPILQQVGAGNPSLAQRIGENPDEFLQLLSEDTGDDMPVPPGAQEISVTEEERDAIERVSLPPLFSLCCELLLICSVMSPRLRARPGHSGLLRV